MCNMMTPDMIRTGMNMQNKMRNPAQGQTQAQPQRDEPVIREAGETGNTSVSNPGRTTGQPPMPDMSQMMQGMDMGAMSKMMEGMDMGAMSQMMQGMNGGSGGMPDMGNMANGGGQAMDSMMQNPAMLDNIFNMVKGNPGLIRGLCGQMGADHPATKFIENSSDAQLEKYMTWIHRLYRWGRPVWPVMKFMFNWYKVILFMIFAYLFKRWFL